MPDNNTLESLNIEINASSQKASDGVGNLIGSLRSLARGVGTVVPALRSLNSELKTLARFHNIKIPAITTKGGTAATGSAAKAIEARAKEFKATASVLKEFKKVNPLEWQSWRYGPNPLPKIDSMVGGTNGMLSEEESRRRNPQWYQDPAEQQRRAMQHLRDNGGTAEWAKDAQRATQGFEELGQKLYGITPAAESAKESMNGMKLVIDELIAKLNQPMQLNLADVVNQLQGIGAGYKSAADSASAFMQLMQTDTPIAQTVRDLNPELQDFCQSAIGAGYKTNELTSDLVGLDGELKQKKTDFGQAEESGKKFGENVGKSISKVGRIAKTMLIRTALRSLMKAFSQSWQAAYEFSNKMHGTFAKSVDQARTMLADTTTTLVQTFAPVLQALIPVFYVISQAIQYLCQGLQWLLSLLGLTSDLFGKSASSINKYYGASDKANKSNKNLLASWDQLNIIQSKNNGSGSGGGGYKPGSLKDIVSAEVGAIMSIIVGEAMLAIGLILCCTGHWGIGIGLMAVGAAAIAKTLVADWGKLPAQIKKTIATIMTIAGTAFLALGLILAFTGHIGLGVGLIAIGAANLAAIMAVSWGEDVTSGVKKTITDIMTIAGVSMLALGIILCCCGVIPLGIGMIIAGAGSLAAAVALNWDSIVSTVTGVMTTIADWFVTKWLQIKGAVELAWSIVSKWWTENISTPLHNAWDAVCDFFGTLFGDSSTEGSIAHWAVGAWDTVSDWWDSSIAKPVESAWNSVSSFFSTLFGDSTTEGSIAKWATDTWNTVAKWWDESISKPVSGAWDSVVSFFTTLFGDSSTNGSIAKAATDAWNTVAMWWDSTIAKPLGNAWDSVSEFFSDLFGSTEVPGSIASFANDAWCVVSDWWDSTIAKPVEGAWNSVSEFFKGLWGSAEEGTGIAGFASKAWDSVSTWWTTNVSSKVEEEGIWGGIKGFFSGIFVGENGEGGILGAFNQMWEGISVFWADNVVKPIKDAWKSIGDWFYDNVTMPIANFFIDCVNTILSGINWIIDQLNTLHITIPAVELPLVGKLWGETVVGISGIAHITLLERLQPRSYATGAYDIPSGDLFIANEAGAELVGSMDGKTTVANQGQIIEGIQRGVRDANAEQMELLRRQNELLVGILEKTGNLQIEPSAAWGKFNQKSDEMWALQTGR